MGKVQTLLLLVLAACIRFVSTQDYLGPDGSKFFDATEGSMYRHIYSTAVYAAAATDKIELSINKTMIAGLFDPAETLSYATGKSFY